MGFNVNELSPDQIHQGMTCKSLEEFQAFVKEQGLDLEEDEAQAIFEEMFEMELSDEELDGVAGGNWATDCHIWSCPDDDGCPENQCHHRRRRGK